VCLSRPQNAQNKSFLTSTNLDKQPLALGQHGSVGAEDAGFCPVLAAFIPRDAAFQEERLAGGNRPQVVNLHVACHGDEAARTYGLAHGLVDQGGDDAAVQVARVALKIAGYDGLSQD